MRTQFHDFLIRPPKHGRSTSAAIVLGLCFAIAGFYVAAQGTVGNLAFNIIPLVLAVSWLGLGWGIGTAFFVTILRALSDLCTAWINPDYFFADADLSRIISNRISGLLIFVCIVVIIHELILLSRQLEERVQARTTALRQANAARERLQHRLLEAGVRERGAIGRDLHDGLGQHLTATAMAARILTSHLQQQQDPLAPAALELEALIKASIHQTRQIARGLLLENVPPGQLEYELEELVATATESFRIPCTLTTEGSAAILDSATSSHFFYIAREALRNALRHAAATRVELHLRIESAQATLTVSDDGIGMEATPDAEADGVGLQIMVQRAEFLGGTLRLLSPTADGQGTRIECLVPLGAAA